MIKNYIIDSEIYQKNAIDQAIIDFQDVADFEFKNNEISVTWDNEEEIETLFWEFMNYVIWIINL